MSFTPEERQTLANLGFLARTELTLSQSEIARFLEMDRVLKADVVASWQEADKGWLVSVMRNIPKHGYYWRELIERFATSMNVAIRPVTVFPIGSSAPAPQPAGSGNPVVNQPPAGATAVAHVVETNSVRIHDDRSLEIGATPVHEPTAFLAEVGIGGYPIKGVPLTVRRGAEILFLCRQPEEDTQEFRREGGTGDRIRCGVVSMNGYDDGFRLIQGAAWINGVMHRSRDVVSIFAMDSKGILSKSTERYFEVDGKQMVERGQAYVIQEDEDEQGEWITVSVRAAGKGLRFACNTETGHVSPNGLNDRMVEIIKPIKNVVAKAPPSND